MTKHTVFVSEDVSSAACALSQIADGRIVAGITDGSWSLISAIQFLAQKIKPIDIIIATWTANKADVSEARRLADLEGVAIRFIVDRSFLTRQPEYCMFCREQFGDESIRVWSCHAKFVLFLGGLYDVLLLTSANLNKNRRIENFTAIAGGPIVGQYQALVERVFVEQNPGVGFKDSKEGRRTSDSLFESVPLGNAMPIEHPAHIACHLSGIASRTRSFRQKMEG